eukprot:CAMPEP_0182550234 /NCGR_PEP_ID=MMETSP1323-20130603/41350_1 /TAXON_ID=236787 /ORGANISM="Florenciella parvula, Strain RCC1693" /LENGTH=49 /DNA_ID= /DNA_START= /DNA_END= /DNA_ORIENTATION=
MKSSVAMLIGLAAVAIDPAAAFIRPASIRSRPASPLSMSGHTDHEPTSA